MKRRKAPARPKLLPLLAALWLCGAATAQPAKKFEPTPAEAAADADGSVPVVIVAPGRPVTVLSSGEDVHGYTERFSSRGGFRRRGASERGAAAAAVHPAARRACYDAAVPGRR